MDAADNQCYADPDTAPEATGTIGDMGDLKHVGGLVHAYLQRIIEASEEDAA